MKQLNKNGDGRYIRTKSKMIKFRIIAALICMCIFGLGYAVDSVQTKMFKVKYFYMAKHKLKNNQFYEHRHAVLENLNTGELDDWAVDDKATEKSILIENNSGLKVVAYFFYVAAVLFFIVFVINIFK